ncbi:MAG: o-succinylbenzoate synthase [Thermoplasmata archaeon]
MELSLYNVKIPLITPFTTSFGTEEYRDAIIFHMKNEGIDAFSESVTSSIPDYGYEDNTTATHIIGDILCKYVTDVPAPEEFMKRSQSVRGHNMAKSAIEMLLWDYYSKYNKKPLDRYLGESRGYANAGISIGMSDLPSMIRQVGQAINRKYKRIKVKIRKGREDIVKAIRDTYPDIHLSVDANTDYSYGDLEYLKKLDRYNLEYIEQPLAGDDLIYHSRLSRQISTPICLDESITSPEKAEKALEIGACSVINIKPGRVGGLLNSIKIAKIAHEYGGHVWIGGMLETGIGRSFNIAMASQKIVDFPGDTSPNDKYFKKDIVTNVFQMEDGTIKTNDGPGIGVGVDYGALFGYTISARRIL